ncbi:hypothetical protein [Bradyrhizobium sp. CCBAU 21360]|uniref:hypothetical protein n=1 Tax=Bradyrhizobium sp. CCBAU 21360 TaxID=1325081 RepID=UPI00230664B5|nr:hypothetical protein [Bradyrhizobium sp. CCBAU 21360]MDA9446109.1 hypothetical protein [Bradyrhizobium sp. CCBAU 21360]
MTDGLSKGDLELEIRFDFDLRKNEIWGEDRETVAWESRESKEAAGVWLSHEACAMYRPSCIS